MARSLSQTLTRFPDSLSTATSTRFLNFRHRSNWAEVFSGESLVVEEVDNVTMKNLEDAIHKIIVRKSQPDWIPLVPGASYWVPPKSKAQGFANVIGKLFHDSAVAAAVMKGGSHANNGFFLPSNRGDDSAAAAAVMKGGSHANKVFFLPSNRGWPSSAHFFKGAPHSSLVGDTASEDEEV